VSAGTIVTGINLLSNSFKTVKYLKSREILFDKYSKTSAVIPESVILDPRGSLRDTAMSFQTAAPARSIFSTLIFSHVHLFIIIVPFVFAIFIIFAVVVEVIIAAIVPRNLLQSIANRLRDALEVGGLPDLSHCDGEGPSRLSQTVEALEDKDEELDTKMRLRVEKRF